MPIIIKQVHCSHSYLWPIHQRENRQDISRPSGYGALDCGVLIKLDFEYLIMIFASFLAALAVSQSSSLLVRLAFFKSLSFSYNTSSNSSVIHDDFRCNPT